jgi:UDP-N-acetylglucosamine 2-epimerase (non-hydrolysing)
LKILNVIGTRPEAIKMAIFHKLLLENEKFEPILCLTGQHTTLVGDVLDVFGLTPNFCCFLGGAFKSMADSMACLLVSIQEVIDLEKPEIIIVQGDTLSSYCGAMVGFLNQIPVAHIEAGLRTHNKWSPYPEEIFRKFNDVLADLHFTGSQSAVLNLEKEGIVDSVYLTGNTGIDALVYIQTKLLKNELRIPDYLENLTAKFKKDNQKIIVLTLHRREGQLTLIPQVLQELNSVVDDLGCQIFFPVHTNPNIQNTIDKLEMNDRIHCISNLVYHEFIWLMMQSDLILTDSGGIQEEAPYLGKPVIVLREVTERQEVIEIGFNKMYRQSHLQEDINEIIENNIETTHKPYGNGQASVEIIKILEKKFFTS